MTYKRVLSLLFGTAVLLIWLTGIALSNPSSGFQIDWSIIAGGGGRSASSDFQVNGSIGQSIAGPPVTVGTNYRIEGGYWAQQAATATPTPVATPPITTPVPPDEWFLYLPEVRK
jgi:hypothetical protein